MADQTETAAAYEIGKADSLRMAGETPYVIVPDGYSVKNLESFLGEPTRKRGKTSLQDAKSFIAFVNREKNSETLLFGSTEPPAFVAVFNAGEENPGWGDHRALYRCPLSIEWQAWSGFDKRVMSQEEFSSFIESNLPDVVAPPAADMLEISRSLQAKKKVNFARGVRLSNGENQLTYEETIDGTAAKGKLSIPETFRIGIPVMQGGTAYAVEARLRWRIKEGGVLVMWYELIRPHKIMADAVEKLREDIEAGTELYCFNGSPGDY